MDLMKTMGVRVVTSILVMTVVAAGILWWRADDATQSAIIGRAGRIVSWTVAVAALPFVTFFVIGWIARRDSNAAGAALVLGYTIVEAVALAWLFDFSIAGSGGWSAFAAAVIVAGLYNLLICDRNADRIES
jgi:FtsH-binding integral membrane protein